MTPGQMKAARALLGWSFRRLAALSDTSIQMVTVFEYTGRVVLINSRNRTMPFDAVAAVRAALETAGIEFTNGDTPGAQMRHSQDRA